MPLSNEDSVDMPSVELPMSIALPSSGVPEHREFENTGEVATAVAAAVASDEDTMTALAKLIISSQPSQDGGGGGGGDAGVKVLKDIKRHKWLAALMAMVLGPGGMTATYYAIKDRGIANESAVQQLTQDAIEIHPKIESNTDDIRLIKVDVSKINKSVDDMKTQQTAIANGIESLKQVNVDRLEKENDKLERKIRALERGR